MIIILLRHEERDLKDPRFFIPLTEKGRINAIKKINKISELNVDQIYCSPFERAIQTILPFCLYNGNKINIENSLYELIEKTLFLNEKIYDQENIKEEYQEIINKDYETYLKKKNFKFGKDGIILQKEKLEDLEERCNNFFNIIMSEYKNTESAILLVSHESTLKMFEKIITEKVFNKSHKYKFIKMGEFREYKI
jgi:broad specificity phosphatase PhoE